MERKTKQRILGIVVVIALVIILLPLFQNGKEPPAEAMLVKAPPFPDQSVQVNAATASAPTPVAAMSNDGTQVTAKGSQQQPDDVIKSDTANTEASAVTQPVNTNSVAAADVVKANITTETSVNDHSANSTAEVKSAELTASAASSDVWSEEEQQAKQQEKQAPTKQAPYKTIMSDDESAAIVKSAIVKAVNPPAHHKKSTAPVLTQSNPLSSESKKTVRTAAKRIPITKVKPTPLMTHEAIDSNGLLGLKNAAWVIQVGSFKNKTNALRLVNQLRASGYRAFIQQFSNNTRVFVGPEIKQGSARAVASRLESEMQIRGIVISYKPLAL